MPRRLFLLIIQIAAFVTVFAQNTEVQNRPYTDLREFHLGVLVGMHLQDIEFNNAGSQMITLANGSQQEQLICCDQDTWDLGFTVGVLAEARLSTHFALRLAPSLYFGSRHLSFINYSEKKMDGTFLRESQDLKSVYIATPLELIFAAQRRNNTRPYVMAGINPMLNLSPKENDFVKLKNFDCFAEVGLGCDFYLPFFKLRPELKFMYSLIDALDKEHPEKLEDLNARKYATSVTGAHTKFVALTFYFE